MPSHQGASQRGRSSKRKREGSTQSMSTPPKKSKSISKAIQPKIMTFLKTKSGGEQVPQMTDETDKEQPPSSSSGLSSTAAFSSFKKSMQECEKALIKHRRREIEILKKNLTKKKRGKVASKDIEEIYAKLLTNPEVCGQLKENDESIIDTLKEIEELTFELAAEASELRNLAQLLKKLRVNKNSPIMSDALWRADDKLKSAAFKKFDLGEANVIWLPYDHLSEEKQKEYGMGILISDWTGTGIKIECYPNSMSVE